ncbi:MAG TPA: trehalose-phosphatase [Candidatus Hypogeohydataceae bacterium YC40]
MKYLFLNLPEVEQRLKHYSKILLFLDYDGTLVPIRKRPSLAILSPAGRQLLERLSRSPKLSVGIATGRSLTDIQRLIAIKELFYIANHGLEISLEGKGWAHPKAERLRPYLKEILSELKKSTRHINGVLLEDKGLTLSVHYRNVPNRFSKELRAVVVSVINRHSEKFIVTHDKKVYEIRPNINWDKGRAVLKLSHYLGKRKMLKIYIGDGRTDEDAFRVMGKGDIAIRVGYKRNSLASYYVKNPKEVVAFLKYLLAALD